MNHETKKLCPICSDTKGTDTICQLGHTAKQMEAYEKGAKKAKGSITATLGSGRCPKCGGHRDESGDCGCDQQPARAN